MRAFCNREGKLASPDLIRWQKVWGWGSSATSQISRPP